MDNRVKKVKKNILKFIKANDMTVKYFVEKELKISRNGFYAMLNSGSLKLSTIFQISEILDIYPETIFTGINSKDKFLNELVQKYADKNEELLKIRSMLAQ